MVTFYKNAAGEIILDDEGAIMTGVTSEDCCCDPGCCYELIHCDDSQISIHVQCSQFPSPPPQIGEVVQVNGICYIVNSGQVVCNSPVTITSLYYCESCNDCPCSGEPYPSCVACDPFLPDAVSVIINASITQDPFSLFKDSCVCTDIPLTWIVPRSRTFACNYNVYRQVSDCSVDPVYQQFIDVNANYSFGVWNVSVSLHQFNGVNRTDFSDASATSCTGTFLLPQAAGGTSHNAQVCILPVPKTVTLIV